MSQQWLAIRYGENALAEHVRPLGNSIWLLADDQVVPTTLLRHLCELPNFELFVLQARARGFLAASLIVDSFARLRAAEIGDPMWAEAIPGGSSISARLRPELHPAYLFFAARCTPDRCDKLAESLHSTVSYRDTLMVLAPTGWSASRRSEIADTFLRQALVAGESEYTSTAAEQWIRTLRSWAEAGDLFPLVELRDADLRQGFAILDGNARLPMDLITSLSTDPATGHNIRPGRFGAPLLDHSASPPPQEQ